METTHFVVPDLDPAGAVDLSNALTALNGVAHVGIDAGTLTVEYDPAYSNPRIIHGNITGAGYRVVPGSERT